MKLALAMILVFAFGAPASAQLEIPKESIEMGTRPKRGSSLDDFFFSGLSTTANRPTIKVYLTCFPADLKTVKNPLSPMAGVMMRIGVGVNSNPTTKTGSGDFSVIFPGWMPWNRYSGMTGPRGTAVTRRSDVFPLTTLRSGSSLIGSAFAFQNTLIIKPPVSTMPPVDVANVGNNDVLHYVNFDQNILGNGNCWGSQARNDFLRPLKGPFAAVLQLLRMPAFAGGGWMDVPGNEINPTTVGTDPNDTGWTEPNCRSNMAGWDPSAWGYTADEIADFKYTYSKYPGRDGSLTGQWRHAFSADYNTLEIYASFPGQVGPCGGFFSPLMLFFDESRPKLTATADFKIYPGVRRTAWPEASASYGFLALDRNDDGIINDGTELFGQTVEHKNGFESLRVYDENRDGRIDSRDSIFSKLRLWKDSTANGRTKASDLLSMKKAGVRSIDLNYDPNHTTIIDDRGEFRERAPFAFSRGGRLKRGQVIDVWFAPR